jgi:signal transduction histidine kinase/ligand-binding sensor domain-containing protein/DNA-binding response OmpR family regulator
MKKSGLLLTFFFVFFALEAQMVKVLNLKDGLSNNYVECILQDAAGYVWIGTRDGLNRYNGHENEVYKEQLSSSFIYSLMQDRAGIIWIGTSRGGITLYDPDEEQFKPLTIEGHRYGFLSDKDVYMMHEDRKGNVWLATLQGLARISDRKDTVVWYQRHSSAFSHSFTSISEDHNGRLWFGTNQGLYYLDSLNASSIQPVPYQQGFLLKGTFIRDVKGDGRGNLWLATDHDGIFVLNPVDGVVKQYNVHREAGKESRQVWKLRIDKYGIIWAALINGGIYRYDRLKDVFVNDQHKIADVFNAESISDIMEDADGNIWITSHGDGVCYFNPHKYVFEKYLSGQSEEGSKARIVSSFSEDDHGNIWIGTDGDGLKRMSQNNVITDVRSVRNGLSSNTILDIVPDAEGKWLATWQGGVVFINDRSGKADIFNEANAGEFGIKTPNVKALLKDSAGRLWIVTHGGGVVVYDITKRKFVDPRSINPAYRPEAAQWGSDIIETRQGEIWIGSHAGLARYTTGKIDQYFPRPGDSTGISGSLIYCLLEDKHGDIWIGTNVSLERYNLKEKRFENFTTRYGVPGNIKCMLEDENGQLWFSTVDRIIALDPVSKTTRVFDHAFNTQLGQFYECACMKSGSGKFYFGGTEGFNAFYPDSVRAAQQPSRVFFTGLSLFNKRQHPGAEGSVLTKSLSQTKEVILAHDQNVVTFDFLAFDYGGFNRNLYSYRMENFDQHWSPPSRTRTATYTNLDPGTYHLHVRVSSPDQVILSEAVLDIKVIPPFWRTLWFQVLVAAIVLLSIVAIFANRLLSSRRKRLLLQRLVEERTKEVRSQNLLLERQAEDLREKNVALTSQESKIREQANVLATQKDLLQKNNASLEELNATKDRLFSIIAHDLRNPFTSLLGFSKLLATDFERYSDEEKLKLVKGVYKSSSGIHSLLENLLVWSKAQQNFLVFAPEKLYLRKLVHEHFDFIRDDADKKQVQLSQEGQEEISFFADRNMLNIVFRNLLSNALKYSPIGGRIDVLCTFLKDGLEITVRDEGTGIEEGVQLFSVTRDDHHRRDHNHGLGLILCREFVEKHGGSIYAGNNAVKGSWFAFTLPSCNPVVVAPTENGVELPQDVETVAELNATRAHQELPLVLLAEDDDNTRWYIKQIIFPDFQVIEAVNGKEADVLAQERIPDLIVSDLTMPKMDGLEFCRQVKSHQQTSHIPFIMLTAERSDEKKVTGFEYGADDYITKPVEPNVLRARLHNLIESRKKLKSIYQRDITAEPEAFTSNPLDQAFLEKLNSVIEAQLSNPELNPDHLAREMNLSRTGLYMKVKALTGESVSIYVRNVRLKESKKLLKSRQMNVSEVAYAVGFNQLPYFTTCFKEAFGMTPSEFLGKKNG